MMKKIIALALALSMALSMVAFAGYTDAAEINQDLQADIDLVGALGLMQGNTDGSFNPTGYLKRGEAAVIIYRLHSGKSTIDASWGDASLSNFSDMDHWSAPYVNYCAALGLIAGYTDGTFRPENNVSTVEMAKMLLNVAGYDTEKQGYGKNWPGAVLADASSAGLFEKFDAAFTGLATREWVAKLVSNMLNVKTVVYAYGSYLEETKNTFGEKYGVQSVVRYAVATPTETVDGDIAVGGKETSKVIAAEKTFDAKNEADTISIKYSIPTELLGHNVTVYYQEGEKAGLENAAKIYAVMDAAKSVIETTMDQVKFDSDKTTLTIAGEKVDEKATSVKSFENLQYVSASYFGTEAKKDNRPVVLVKNADGDWRVFFNKVAYTTVEDIDTAKYTFKTADGTITYAYGAEATKTQKETFAKVNFVDTVAKKDFIAVEVVGNKAVTYNVTKINALRTKISSNLNNEKFTVGATTYEGAQSYAGFVDFVKELTGGENGGLTKTYDIYTDGKYVVYATEYKPGTTTSSGLNLDVVMLIDAQKGTGATAFDSAVSDKVQVMLNNGSIAVYEYAAPTAEEAKKVEFSAIANADGVLKNAKEQIYELVLNDDGSVYFKGKAHEFTNTKSAFVDNAALTGLVVDKSVNKTVATLGTGADAKLLFADENSFLFVRLLDKKGNAVYSVVKVSELAAKGDWTKGYTFGDTTAYTFNKNTGLNTLAYAVVTSDETKLPATPDTATGSDWFLVTKTATAVITEAGTTYAVQGVNNKGEAVTLSLTSNKLDKTGAEIEAGKVYTVMTSSKDTYLSYCKAWTTETVKAISGNSVLFVDDTALTDIASDAVIVYVQVNKDGDLVKVDGPATLPLNAKVYVTTDKNGFTDIIALVGDKNAAADVTTKVSFIGEAPKA